MAMSPPAVARLAALGLLAAASTSPAWRAPAIQQPIVLLDASASMAVHHQDPRTLLTAWLQANPQLETVALGTFAAVASPPVALPANHPIPDLPPVDRSATHIEAALRRALEVAEPHQPVVLLSDGVETTGDATKLLGRAGERSIRVYAVEPGAGSEPSAAIDDVQLPDVVAPGEAFTAAVAITGTARQPGRLEVYGNRASAWSGPLTVPAGRTVLPVPLTAPSTGPLELRFALHADADASDADNGWQALVEVTGAIEVHYVAAPGEEPPLLASLTAGGWPVTRIPPERLGWSVSRRPAVLVLDDVPVSAAAPEAWTALTHAVRNEGMGLVVLGGERAFGGGGYRGSTLETVLPVTAEAGVPLPPAAAVFVLDRSGSMGRHVQGRSPWAYARGAVVRTAASLTRDQVGIVAFHQNAETLLPLGRHADLDRHVRTALEPVAPAGPTRLAEGLELALDHLAGSEARHRLLILLTDGFTATEDLAGARRRIRDLGVDVIGLAVGGDADLRVLDSLCRLNDGLLLRLDDVARLPQLMAEAVGSRRATVTRTATAPVAVAPVPFLAAAPPWPRLEGYAVTRARDDATVHLRAPRGDPLLVSGRAGLGTVVALPGGLGPFAAQWPRWAAWSDFAGGLVEWAAGSRDAAPARLSLHLRGPQPRVELDLVDDRGDWLAADAADAMGAAAWLAPPGGSPLSRVHFTAVAPGRLVAPLPLREPGHHHLSVRIGDLSIRRSFVHRPRAELQGESMLEPWRRAGLVHPWPSGGIAPQPGQQPLGPLLIAAALAGYVLSMLLETRRSS